MIEVRWHGRGGQGAFTASKILGAAVVAKGEYALSFPSFGPERRGAPVQAFTKISDEMIADRSVLKKADYIVYLDETLFKEQVLEDLKEHGTLFLNTKTPEKYRDYKNIVAIKADEIAKNILGRPVSNTAMLCVLAVYTNLASVDDIKSVLKEFLSEKIAIKNEKVLDEIGVIYDKTKFKGL